MGSIPGPERSLEGGNATHSSIFAWEIPWTEEPGRLHSERSQRVRYNIATKTATTIESNTLGFKSERCVISNMGRKLNPVTS